MRVWEMDATEHLIFNVQKVITDYYQVSLGLNWLIGACTSHEVHVGRVKRSNYCPFYVGEAKEHFLCGPMEKLDVDADCRVKQAFMYIAGG